MNHEDNPQLALARSLMEDTGTNLFLTGKAGTGKTTFLRDFRASTSKRVVVVAPTGIAAINAGGVTIHSFFQLSFSPYVPGASLSGERRRYDRFSREKLRIIRSMDVLVIDEMSMVRADLLDAIDAVLRRHRDPTRCFGGVQLLMIGDLQQLAPVVKDDEAELLRPYYQSNYFFDSHALRQVGYETVELEKVYRQKDKEFLELLNRIRTNTADYNVLSRLNQRYIAGFNPPAEAGYIRLTTHNRLAHDINDRELDKLNTPLFTFEAKVSGDFPESSYPAEHLLTLRKGAQVMFIKNDTTAHRYYNGMIGKVIAINSSGIQVRPVDGGDIIDVAPEEWENNRYTIDPESRAITEEVTGTFSQYPLRLAWAITIHKSQGLTFDRAIIDATSSFAHGQTYVALSRCRTLEGLVLERPLSVTSIISDAKVSDFVSECACHTPDENRMIELRLVYTMSLLGELFGMRRLRMAFEGMHRVLKESMQNTYPQLLAEWGLSGHKLNDEVDKVAQRFLGQCQNILASGVEGGMEFLQSRVKAASGYFGKMTDEFLALLSHTPVNPDNREMRNRLIQRRDDLHEILSVKQALFTAFGSDISFSASEFLRLKAKAVLDLEGVKTVKTTSKSNSVKPAVQHREPEDIIPDEVKNQKLFKELLTWRRNKVNESGLTASRIMSTANLVRLANNPPGNIRALSMLKGFGGRKTELYGKELVAITQRYVPEAEHRTGDPEADRPISKIPSWQMSMQLFEQGYSIEAIAEHRLLAISTISGHLAQAVVEGVLPIERVVSAERVEALVAEFRAPEDPKATQTLYERLSQKYSPTEITVVRRWLNAGAGDL
ncbi:MAG: AAA family ATPase [Muribaculaceae bacterium]|nr:AAA family ATPase [Muribaculaceae bacterium]